MLKSLLFFFFTCYASFLSNDLFMCRRKKLNCTKQLSRWNRMEKVMQLCRYISILPGLSIHLEKLWSTYVSHLVIWNFQAHVDRIQTDLDELVTSLNERCKKYGLHAKPTTLLELPFGKFKFIIDFVITFSPSQIFFVSMISLYGI